MPKALPGNRARSYGVHRPAMVKKPRKGGGGGEETRYRNLFEWRPISVCVLTDGIITLINQAGARSLGAKDADIVIGEPFKSFVHPDCHDAVSDDLADVAKGGPGCR